MRATASCVVVFLAILSGGYTPETQSAPNGGTPSRGLPAQGRRDCDFAAERPLRVTDWLHNGNITRRVEPTFPDEARRLGIHGRVSVGILLNSRGEVEKVCGDGQTLLRVAAEAAALQWRFRVSKLNGSYIDYLKDALTFDFARSEAITPGQRSKSAALA